MCESVCGCRSDAGGPEPARRLQRTTDYLYNMTDKDLPTWLLKTHDDYSKER